MADEPKLKLTVNGRDIDISRWDHTGEDMLAIERYAVAMPLDEWPTFVKGVDAAIDAYRSLQALTPHDPEGPVR